jgi:hypothetical protein
VRSVLAGLRTLVLPFGATSGARIVADGTTGRIYVYNSAGDLIALLTPSTYTNGPTSVVAGFYTGVLDGATSDQYIGLDPVGSPSLDMKLPRAGGIDYSPAFVEAANFGSPNFNGYILARSPLATTQTTGTDDARVMIINRSTNGVAPSSVDIRADQFQIYGRINLANSSGVLVTPATPKIEAVLTGTVETWHAVVFQNGWSNVGGVNVTAQYRQVACPPQCVQLVGTIAPGTKTDGTILFNLPAGYRPAHDQFFPLATNGAAGGGTTPQVSVAQNGDVKVFGVNTVGLTNIEFGCLVSLDA